MRKAPKQLTKESGAWWSQVAMEFDLVSGGELQVLTEAALSLDRISQCRDILDSEGLIVSGDRGKTIHPAARLEQQHRALVMQACRQLGISMPAKK